MKKKLAVIAFGNSRAGKSTTWDTLYQAVLRTGSKPRKLYLNKAQYVDDTFVVAGSAEERGEKIESLVPRRRPTIVFCSIQYVAAGNRTFDFFFRNGYDVFVVWLNPGARDAATYPDHLKMIERLLLKGGVIQQRSAKTPKAPVERAQEIRQFVLGWATYRDLVRTEFP